jgi:hypothetical protein
MSQRYSPRAEAQASQSPGIFDLVRRYCVLIEGSGPQAPQWLHEVSELLPRLHAAFTSLKLTGPAKRGDDLTPDLDARFELFSHLRRLLDDRDGYWLEFDRLDDCNAMTGSLADDLTDIYCELKHGLRFADSQPDRAIRDWVNGYVFHWRRHLMDAERHLATLAAQERLD